MSDETVLVSESKPTPTVSSGSLTDALFFVDNDIDYTDDFATLFDDAVFMTNQDADNEAITVMVDKDKLEVVTDRVASLKEIDVKNVNDVIAVLTNAKSRVSTGSALVGFSREDIDTLANFMNQLPAIDVQLQSLKDDASLILKPIALSDVMVLPTNDYTEKIASALNDDSYVDEKIEESAVLSADMGVASVGSETTNMEQIKTDVQIDNFGTSLISNSGKYQRDILKQIDDGLDSLLSARTLLTDLWSMSVLDVTPTELSSLDGSLSILEQDWSGTITKTNVTGVTATATYGALITTYARVSRYKTAVTTFYDTNYVVNIDTIAEFASPTLDNVTVIGSLTGKTYTLATFRGVLSSLKSIWSRLVNRITSTDTFNTLTASATKYVDTKLTDVNKVFGTNYTSADIINILKTGFSTPASANLSTAAASVSVMGANILPLLLRGMSNKIANVSMDKSKLLSRTRNMAQMVQSEIQSTTGYSGILRRYRVAKVKRSTKNVTNSNSYDMRARRAARSLLLSRINN